MKRRMVFIVLFCLSYPAFSTDNYILTEIKWSHYLTEPKEDYQRQNYTWFYAKANQLYRSGPFAFKLTGLTQFSIDKKDQFYFNVPELYASYSYRFKKISLLDSIRVSLGRELKAWNYFDEYFELGLWNSLNLWDPLYPTANGLVGSFIDFVSSHWSLHFFIGGVFVPSLSVNIEQDEEKIFSTSRWFSGVPRRVETLGRVLDIDYWVHTPFISDVIFQESYIASLNLWTEKEKNMWMKFNAGYKPINQIVLARNSESILRISSDSEASIHQELFIFPIQHRIFSVEWGFKHNNASLLLSAGDNAIIEENIPEGWALVNKALGFTYFSSFLKYEFAVKDRLKNQVQLSYIYTVPHDRLVKNGKASSSHSYKMVQGIGVDWKTKVFASQDEIAELSVRYWYSLTDKGGLLLANLTYHITPFIYLQGTLDILGSKQEDSFTFLNRFRANDRIEWRVGYVF